MAHHATKQAACANCRYAFVPGEPDEFCPNCGQQNHAVEIGFSHVLEEFLEGIFHFDGKVFRTAGLLLFKPGELTRRFLAGHRVPYVPPIRLYVFISFVFFLLLGTQLGHEERGQQAKPKQVVTVDARGGVELGLGADSSKLAPGQQAQLRQSVDSVNRAIAAALGPASPRVAGALQKARKAEKTRVQTGISLKSLADHLPSDPTDAQVDSVLRKNGETPDFLH